MAQVIEFPDCKAQIEKGGDPAKRLADLKLELEMLKVDIDRFMAPHAKDTKKHA